METVGICLSLMVGPARSAGPFLGILAGKAIAAREGFQPRSLAHGRRRDELG